MTIPNGLLSLINSIFGQSWQPYRVLESGLMRETQCVAWTVIPKLANSSLLHIRSILQNQFICYKGNLLWVSGESTESDTIVLCPTQNQFDILNIEQTSALNYGITTIDVVEKLRFLDRQYGIDIRGASCASIEFKFIKPPIGIEAINLAETLLSFAPDIYRPPHNISDPIALWWD